MKSSHDHTGFLGVIVLRAERQGANEYLKRRQREGRQRGALWKRTEQNAEETGNSWSEVLAAAAQPK